MQTACLLPRPPLTVLPKHLGEPSHTQRLVSAARSELAARLHIPAASLAVERVERATFTDTSFGFPERDVCYGPAIIDGHVIRFARGDHHWEFHGISDDVEHGVFGKVPARGTPLYWRRGPQGIFLPD